MNTVYHLTGWQLFWIVFVSGLIGRGFWEGVKAVARPKPKSEAVKAEELPPFPSSCPKCGVAESPVWVYPPLSKTFVPARGDMPEHMRVQCKHCGYTWKTQPGLFRRY